MAATVLVPAIIIRAAGGTESYLSWAVFAAVAVCGATTVLQAVRFGQIGSGYVLLMSISGASIAVSITALAEGGGDARHPGRRLLGRPAALSARLSLLRRILTPTVTGTVIMLIPVTVMSHVFNMLKDVPDGIPAVAAPLSAFTTILVIAGSILKGTGVLRLWAPVIGVVAGSAVAWLFGLYDIARVIEASWIGLPQGAWPGFDLDFGPVFWTLLPAFVFVALIDTMQTISASVAIQQVSWRQPRTVDFRAVQGAVAAAGVAKLLAGLSGTVPNTTYSTTVSVTELTGVGARSVGIALGAVLIVLAFLPKALAVVLAIPGPVVSAYLAVFLAMLFVIGMNLVVQDGIDYRKGLVCGVAFWMGVGFQNGMIFPRVCFGIRRRSSSERDDGRRVRGHPHDPVHGSDKTSTPAGGGVQGLGPAEDQGVSLRIRVPKRLGCKDGEPARRRQRGDSADAHTTGRRRRPALAPGCLQGRRRGGP